MAKPKTGPAALLALVAKGECRKLSHNHCSLPGCPCDDARTWLRTLSASTTIDAMWKSCERRDWKSWVTTALCVAFKSTMTWSDVIAETKRPKSERAVKCDYCDEDFAPDEIVDGHCEECSSEHFVSCKFCGDVSRDDNYPCNHMRWSDDAAGFVGPGAYDEEHGVAESIDAVCSRLGLRATEELREALASLEFWRSYHDLGEALEKLEHESRDRDDVNTEVGLYWLDMLNAAEHLRPQVLQVIQWIDEHVARREEVLLAERRPRYLVRDSGGRYWVAGAWTAVLEQGHWMHRARAHKTRRLLRKMHPGTGFVVVHILTPTPAFPKEARR